MAARPKKYKKKETDGQKLVKLAKERYKRAQDAQSAENKAFDADVEFAFDAEAQWDPEMRKQRELDMRPCLTVNRFPQFIRQVVNDYRQNTPAIKVMPVDDGADKETAEIFSGIIRHIEQASGADMAKENAVLYSVSGGKGFYRITTDYLEGSFDQDIKIEPIANTRTVTYDCDDTSLDGSGWNWCFIEDSISGEEWDARYPGKDRSAWDGDGSDVWVEDSGDKIKIAEYFYREMEKKTLCLLENGDTVLEDDLQEGMKVEKTREVEVPVVKWCILGGNESEPLEEKEWAGKYIPVVPVFGDVVMIKGKVVRLSLIRYSKDAQRMINFWRSSEAEMLSLQQKAPYMVTTTQVEGHEDKWAMANAANMPYLEYNADPQAPPPMRQGFAPPPSGVLSAIAGAGQDLKDTTGIQDAGLGKESNEQSGKAILARQAEGDNATFHFIDNAARADRYCGMILIDLIPKIYDTPRIVRTLGLDGSEEMKRVNEEFEEKDEWGKAIKKIYALDAGVYDVVVNSGPSYNTKRQQAVDAMTQILQGNPQLMGVAGDLFVKAMDWPGSEELAERIKKTIPPEILPPEEDEDNQMPPEIRAQFEQMQGQMQEMDQMLQQQAAQLESKQIEYELKSREIAVKEADAETKRMVALREPAKQLESDITEGEKLEIETAKALRLEEMRQEHERDMAVLKARMDKITAGELTDVDQDGNECPSKLSVAIEALVQGQQQLAAQMEQTSSQIAELSAIGAAPKRVVRDDMGNLVGVEVVQ